MPNPENIIGKGFDKRPENINRKGAPKKLPNLDLLIAEVLGEEKNGLTAAEAILKVIRNKATNGDLRAAELLFDRGYGKAKQQTDITTNGKDMIPTIVFKDISGNQIDG